MGGGDGAKVALGIEVVGVGRVMSGWGGHKLVCGMIGQFVARPALAFGNWKLADGIRGIRLLAMGG